MLFDTERNMAEKDFTVQGSTAAKMTTTEFLLHTATGSEDLSFVSSRGVGPLNVYFHCAVVVIGIVGTANALVLYALVASKQHKKHVLIVNINALDLFSCLFLILSYTVKLSSSSIRLTETLGYWLCTTILSDTFVWWGITGSRFGLTAITLDRYLSVVHSAWSKKWLRKWMLCLAVASSWGVSLIYSFTVIFSSTAVVDGVCYTVAVWDNVVQKTILGICTFVLLDISTLLIIVFCYGRILVVIRRQTRAMAGHGSFTAQIPSHRMQTNVVKTMILVSALFVVTNFPVDIYFLLWNVNITLVELGGDYYSVLFIVFLYSCSNPFIYAVKFDPVKSALLSLILCRRS